METAKLKVMIPPPAAMLPSRAFLVQWLILIGLMMWIFVACGGGCTIAPRQIVYAKPSFDENNVANSGMLGMAAGGSEIIRASVRSNYNALITIYGTRYLPALRADDGITAYTNGTYLMDRTHLTGYLEMCVWKRNNK